MGVDNRVVRLEFARRNCAQPALAQLEPGMPMIGFLDATSPETFANRLRGFSQGLKETMTIAPLGPDYSGD